MPVISCLLPMILTVVGATVGGITGGTTGGLWGAAAGFAGGFVLMLGVIWLFDRAKDKLRESTRTNHDRHCQWDKSDVLIGRWLTVCRVTLGRVRSTRGEQRESQTRQYHAADDADHAERYSEDA